MKAGNLDRLVQFRRATPTDDGLAVVDVWSDHGDPVWAAKKDASDAERWRAGEVQASITTRFTVRWSEFARDISPKDRLTCDGVDYDITGIKEVGPRRTFLEITAAARAD